MSDFMYKTLNFYLRLILSHTTILLSFENITQFISDLSLKVEKLNIFFFIDLFEDNPIRIFTKPQILIHQWCLLAFFTKIVAIVIDYYSFINNVYTTNKFCAEIYNLSILESLLKILNFSSH